MSTEFLVGAAFAIVQMIFNVLLGLIAWQWKRGESRRDEQIKSLNEELGLARRDWAASCRDRHERVDQRLERANTRQTEAEVGIAVKVADIMVRFSEQFARKADLAAWRDEVRENLHRIFERLDEGNKRMERLSTLIEERTGQ